MTKKLFNSQNIIKGTYYLGIILNIYRYEYMIIIIIITNENEFNNLLMLNTGFK